MKREFKNSIIFFGDSICAGYGVGEDKSFPALLHNSGWEVKNISVSGALTYEMEVYVDLLRSMTEYERVFLMLGFNDIVNFSVEKTMNHLRRLRASMDSIGFAVVHGVYPDFELDQVMDESPMIERGLSAKFKDFQQHVIDLALELGDEYVDLRNAISSADEDYEHNYLDGIHLNRRGHEKIYEYIKTVL